MSMWDVIIIAVVCLAIFRGYFKGLCRRLSDWVGLVIAFVASTLSVSHIVAKLYIVFFKLITKIHYNTDSRQITPVV